MTPIFSSLGRLLNKKLKNKKLTKHNSCVDV